MSYFLYLLFNATATSEIYTLSLHDALPIFTGGAAGVHSRSCDVTVLRIASPRAGPHARRFLCLLDAVLLRQGRDERLDRKSTRLNSSHPSISYAVFCLKKKKDLE